MEFPSWRVASRKAAIAHELVHVFFPSGNRFLAEGLAVYLQAEIGGNPAFPNFGRPLHELARKLLREMIPSFSPGHPDSLAQLHLADLDAIATPSPLELKVSQEVRLSRLVKDAVYKSEAKQLQLPVRKAAELVDGLILFLQQLIPPDSGDAESPL